ncbi:MAG: response regulator [Rhizobium sp.]|nr:response regulator [Rhizobium sp.]
MNVLIVEDEVLLALELENELENAGHQVVGEAMSSGEAIDIASSRRPDLAFVDIHLQDGPTGVEVGRHLAAEGIPFVFMTGNLKRVPEDFAGAIGVIEKPYSVNGFRNALGYLARRVSGVRTNELVPPSLIVPAATEQVG